MKSSVRWFGLPLLLATTAWGAIGGDPKKPYADRESDVAREHVEQLSEARHEYRVQFAGTVDGVMTRAPVGYGAFVQSWQPNRSVLIENLGDTDVRNPRIVVNGRGDWQTLSSVVTEATRGYESDADRARAIWEFVRRQRFHACTWDEECSDALKALNVYGYTLCGNQSRVLDDLWSAAGLKTRRGYPIGHSVGEVFFDGRFHMLDSDEHIICLLRDNATIASEEDMVRDHDLIKRTHAYGIGQRESRRTDEFSASLYVHEGKREGKFRQATRHSMDLNLRPGESIEFRWDHVGKQYTAGQALGPGDQRRDGLGDLLAGWGPIAYDNLRNGKLRYAPDLSKAASRRGAEGSENVVWNSNSTSVDVVDPDQPAHVTWRFASPFVFVGGTARAKIEPSQAVAEWRYSTDGRTWTQLPPQVGSDLNPEIVTRLDEVVSPRNRPTYAFWLQLGLKGRARVRGVVFEHDIQTSALGVPELTVGSNRVVYTDASADSRRVRITHRWLERSDWHPPHPPAKALMPEDGVSVEGTRVRFAWSPATDPDGDAIADYHFELSAYPDMRWPLSPNFERRTSLTPSKGKPEWTVSYVGLLNPDTTYYWHVRARDRNDVWGPWSRTFRFRAQSPGVPLDVQLVADAPSGLRLTWRANPQGRPPVGYRVYGSDERGFTISDTEYTVFRGKGFVRSMEEYETKPADAPDGGEVKTLANFIEQVRETSLRVAGPGISLPNTNKAFYRVVAVDAENNQSGPSDLAEVPRPFVCSQLPSPVKVGVAISYQPQVIRSLGDLRCRSSDKSSYNAAFWDREEVSFKPVQLPGGFEMDPRTGLVTGAPRTAGELSLAFEVSSSTGKSITVTQPLRVEQ